MLTIQGSSVVEDINISAYLVQEIFWLKLMKLNGRISCLFLSIHVTLSLVQALWCLIPQNRAQDLCDLIRQNLKVQHC
jgi:hypothetical protein